MTHLNIQQGLNIEVVSTLIIKKLYEAALSVPEPLEGELDAAYMSGNLLVDKTYRALVLYLTNRFDDLHINVIGDYYIDFVDPLVLSVLLANNFSSDGVGITESDAASANLLTKFANNSNITTFNEFKYFTSVNKTDTGSSQTFINCTNLSEIDLTEWEVALLRLFENTAITTVNAPKLSRYGSSYGAVGTFLSNSHLTTVQSLGHVTKIVENMFANCINLATVNLPQECTTIEKLAFLVSYNQGEGHLTTINLDNITTIGLRAFQELRRLAKTLPTDMPSLTSIGDYAFENCVALTGSINYPNLTSISESAFAGCSGLNGTVNLPNLTYLGEYAFYGTSGITEINFRNSLVTSIPKGVFSGSSAKKIHFPKTVITLQNLWYEGMSSLDKFTGLDNIQTHPMIVGIIENGNVKNPIAFKKITGVDQYLVRAANRNNTSVHSLFLPKMQITYSSNEEVLSTPKSTEFTYLSLGLGATSFKLLYYKDIQTFGLGTFYYTNIDNLVINNTTVPTYDTTNLSNFTSGSTLYNNLSSLFGGAINIGTIWVPDSAISTYQASPLFSGMTIKGIDTKTNGTDYDLPRFATLEDWESAAATAEANSQPLPVGLIEEYM